MNTIIEYINDIASRNILPLIVLLGWILFSIYIYIQYKEMFPKQYKDQEYELPISIFFFRLIFSVWILIGILSVYYYVR